MALSPAQIGRISQARMNASCGKVMHTRALPAARRLSRVVDYAGIAVPLILLTMTVVVFRLGVPELAFVIIADVIGLGLALLVALKEFFKWQDKYADHQRLLQENIDLAREAGRLLERREKVSAEVADLFLDRADELDRHDLAPHPI